MNLTFAYSPEKDVTNFHFASQSLGHGGAPSRVQCEYNEIYGKGLDDDKLAQFISGYIASHHLDMAALASEYAARWSRVSGQFFQRAGELFNISLPTDTVAAYLTVNDRCGYSVDGGFFFVSATTHRPVATCMHELWHFYTWHAYADKLREAGLTKQQFYDLEESLTAVLNLEFPSLMDAEDGDYPQHRELRNDAVYFWQKSKNMDELVNHLAKKIVV